MYLKALEIQGFKSFPTKTVLTFDRDITAIVGPNGSGKSNISDAVRWVLGEQSTKQLRGSRMEDVIFGGTPKRPQSGYAEVSLVLDNEDGELNWDTPEVSITRRYYRSGEGEYFINRQAVRLKDINELFMDTGLGREGYSNISQGRIDEILSLKSTDRREIFEEAAGISKYRYRKHEAERRLKDTEDNLVRLGDKIAELELQVEPLRKQSEVAKKYLLLRDQVRVLEVSQWLEDMQRLSAQAEKTQADYAAASRELEAGNAALEALYRQAEALGEQLRQQDGGLQTLRERQQTLERTQAEAEQNWAVLKTNHENNTQNIQRLQTQLDQQTGRADSVGEQIAGREARLLELDQADARQARDQAAAQGEFDALASQLTDLTRQREDLAARLRQAQSLEAELKASLSAFTGSEQTLLDRETAVLQERSDLMLRAESAQAELDQAKADQAKAKEKLSQAENMLSGYTLRQNARQNALDQQTRALSEAGVELKTLQAKAALLREMQREYEGFNKAVRQVLQERDRGALPGIHGPVPELIKTRDDYAVAIETALGGSMQSIVVEDENVGKRAIRMLKARNAGRATFLPLSVIRGRTLNEKNLDRCEGYLGLASDLVTYDPVYREIIQNLLGRTVVADTLDHAVSIADQYGHRFRIVTQDGQVLQAGGSMTGGSAASSAGVLSRANELGRLEQQEQILSQRQADCQQAVRDAQKALDETRRASAAAQEGLLAAQEALSGCNEDTARKELLLQTIQQALETARQELDGLGDKLESGRDQAGRLELQIASVRQNIQDLERQDQALSQQQAGLMTRQSTWTETLTRLRMEVSARQAERQAAQTSLEELKNLQTAMAGDRTRSQALIEQYSGQNDELTRQMQSLSAQTEALTKDLDQVRQEAQALQTARAQTEMQKTGAERQQQEANRSLLLLERECARLEQRKNAAGLEEKQLADKLWDNYELTVSTAQPLRQPVTEETVRQIAALRRQIAALGTPNLGAIDEFERVNERYTFLTTQRDDVQQSKDELEAVIAELTQEMTAIFGREFERIRTAFAETFTELFGGGKANLELEDRENILECGIEIQVQPPGKQLKTITLLSGGEKAFVAIALYFAILKVRPTPFCILDEIDAALDDRNVARFAAYLRRFTVDTQFILITHRRGTMEASDVLYGVTMVEQGVSRMLTLELSRVEETLHMQTD